MEKPISVNGRAAHAKRIRIALLVVLLAVAGLVLVIHPPSTLSPEINVLSSSYQMQARDLPVPDRWIPPTWGWLWRLRYALLGTPARVQIEARNFALTDASALRLKELLKPWKPAASTNGIEAWILPDREFSTLRKQIGALPDYITLSRPRVDTGHGIESRLSVATTVPIDGGQVPVGTFADFLPEVHGKSVVLTTVMTFTEALTNRLETQGETPSNTLVSLRTNLSLAARLQLPEGHHAILLQRRQESPDSKIAGVMISSKVKP